VNHQTKSRWIPGLAAALLLVAAPLTSAKVFKLTAGSSHPPIIPWVGTIHNFVVPESNRRLKAMGSPDRIKWTEAYAGALYNFKNTLEGVQDGLADIGWVGTLWEPSKLPLHNVTFYTPFVTDNVKVLEKIENDMHRDIPAMNQQWRKYNQIYLGPQVIDAYVIITKAPIRSLVDLKGKKFMAPGAVSRWLEGTGAIAVNGGLPVYYNNLKTGVADGAILPGTGILPFKLHEVAPYVTQANLGGGITGALTMNFNTWNGLPPQMQKLFKQLGHEYGQLVTKRVAANKVKQFKILAKKGAIISTLPRAEQVKWANSLPDIAAQWVKQNEAKGLPARRVLTTFMNAVRKAGIKPLREWDQAL